MYGIRLNLRNVVKYAVACLAVTGILILSCNEPSDPSVNMQNVTLNGKVLNESGSPLGGVKVTSGTAETTTDSDGSFSMSKVNVQGKRAVIKFEKNGYFPLTRSGLKDDDMYLEAALYPKGNSAISLQTKFDADKETVLKVGNMAVELSASSVVKEDGSEYSGQVNADMLYLDPNNAKFAELMPGGDLSATRANGSEAVLVSYGMSDVSFTDNSGKSLKLKGGEIKAEVTFPIPAGMEKDAPATMPLWSFDEAKGVWKEEGVAVKKGNVYVGETTHFSWINCDDPFNTATITGKVVCPDGKIANHIPLKLQGANGMGGVSVFTNSDGEYTFFVPANTDVTVSVEAINGWDAATVNVPPGTTKTVRDLKGRCDGGAGEKGTIRYQTPSGGCVITFANYGNRFRIDTYSGNESNRSVVSIVNHYTKTDWEGTSWDKVWIDKEYTEKGTAYTFTEYRVDEIAFAPYLQSNTMTIAGKSCKVYKWPNGSVMASWNGLMMMSEYNGLVHFLATNVSLEVPEVAFTKTFTITWI